MRMMLSNLLTLAVCVALLVPDVSAGFAGSSSAFLPAAPPLDEKAGDATDTTSTVGKDKAEGESDEDEVMSAKTFAGLKLRSIGPAYLSGRIADFAVNPGNRAHYFAAVCSGGVWKTVNAGTTWTPIFVDTRTSRAGTGKPRSISCSTTGARLPSTSARTSKIASPGNRWATRAST